MTTQTTLLQLDTLSIKTDDNEVLVEPLSLTLAQGQALTILGETGSGKSLLAQAIMGILPQGLSATGHIYFDGVLLDEKKASMLWGTKIAMLAQEPMNSLDPTMSVFGQVYEGFYYVARQLKQAAKQKTHDILATLGLANFAPYYPHQLSGGMAQRAAFATATAGGAMLVIADEPTKGLDAHNRQIVIDLLKQVIAKGGALLTITHDIVVANALAQTPKAKLMVMKKGQLLESGDAKQVLAVPQSAYAQHLMAAAPSNWQAHQKLPSQAPILLSVNNLAIKRGKRMLFRGLTMSVRAGEVIGIVGDSGIGKSSLGDVLCGLLAPALGDVQWTKKPKRHQVLKLYQDPPSAFASHVPLQVLLDDVINKHHLDKTIIPTLLDELQLDEQLLTRSASQVSGGELQRIAILRALLFRPVFLFADEVTSRLDPITQKQTMDLLVAQCQQNNCALLMVSHDHDLMNYYCHQVIDLTQFIKVY